MASELLARTSQIHPPVDLKRLVDLWNGLSVALDELDNAGYLLKLGKHDGEILVKASDREPRRRWTVAHELGHWVLDQENVWAASAPPPPGAHSTLELWCDEFAANLLMPAEWIRSDLRRAGVQELTRGVMALPHRYNVSKKAARIRVAKVTPVSLFEFEFDAGTWMQKERYPAPGALDPLASAQAVLRCHASGEELPYRTVVDRDTRVLCYRESRRRLLVAVVPPRAETTTTLRVDG